MNVSRAVLADSHYWIEYFNGNRTPTSRPAGASRSLTNDERAAVAESIQQFQLGEGARGRGLIRRAERYANRSGDTAFVPALRMFIAEEQRHSSELAAFMTEQGIAVLGAHWVDTIFRKLRKLAGLEVCAGVLVTAELIAIPYYRALHDATQCPWLRALCRRILRDEVQHIRFQASLFARLRMRRSSPFRRSSAALHEFFLICTALLVWREHHTVLQRGNYHFAKFLAECRRAFARFDAEAERRLSVFRADSTAVLARTVPARPPATF